MKTLMTLFLFTCVSFVNAQTFIPTSGMKIKCFDSVSNYIYALKIVDIGDEEGSISIFKRNTIIARYRSVIFNENTEESSFIFDNGNSTEEFSIHFPFNDLDQAYFMDAGDSRGLICTI